MHSQKILLTKQGLNDLKEEFNELVSKKRPAAVARFSLAKSLGDLTENSEYAAALEELSFIDGRIAELEEVIKQAQTVALSHGKKHIDVGCQVVVRVNGKKEVFTIVGEWEADPKKKKISHSSPLGQALLGKKKGEKIEVDAPAGTIVYTIVDIV